MEKGIHNKIRWQDPCPWQIYVVGYLAIVFSKVVYQLLFSSCLGPTSETSSSSSHLEKYRMLRTNMVLFHIGL
jgi:hypothetical protein